VTDEQRSRWRIFIATLQAVASWLFFRVVRSLRIHSDMLVARALKNSQLIRPLPDETHVSYGTGHLNQSLRDRAARDTNGVHALPQLAGESVSAFCLPCLRPAGRNATSECEGNARACPNRISAQGKSVSGTIVDYSKTS